MPNFHIFGLTIADGGTTRALDTVQGFLRSGGKHLVVTANPEILVYARRHPAYRQVLRQAALIVPDGAGVVFASWLSGQPLIFGRVTGVELVEKLVSESTKRGFSIFLAGASNDVLQKATQYLAYKYGKINIVGYSEGPLFRADSKFPLNDSKNEELINKIRQASPDILLVGFGHPKQELWLSYYLPQLSVKVGIGVGGTFDYLSGVVARAPGLFQSLGLEWLWRLVNEPRRFKRIFTAVVVFPLILVIDLFKGLFHVEQNKA